MAAFTETLSVTRDPEPWGEALLKASQPSVVFGLGQLLRSKVVARHCVGTRSDSRDRFIRQRSGRTGVTVSSGPGWGGPLDRAIGLQSAEAWGPSGLAAID